VLSLPGCSSFPPASASSSTRCSTRTGGAC
jgi:hypothetical protein